MKRPITKTYAAVYLSQSDSDAIYDFLSYGWGIQPGTISRNLHVTLYSSPMRLPELRSSREEVRIDCDISETRFMLMAPGGENPRPEISSAFNKVGIRFTRRNVGIESIQNLRRRVCYYETPEILGRRRPSTHTHNAFGAREFQPHMTLLKPGAKIGADLYEIGAAFRRHFQYICLDNFVVKVN